MVVPSVLWVNAVSLNAVSLLIAAGSTTRGASVIESCRHFNSRRAAPFDGDSVQFAPQMVHESLPLSDYNLSL
jgi:hypothetical protein